LSQELRLVPDTGVKAGARHRRVEASVLVTVVVGVKDCCSRHMRVKAASISMTPPIESFDLASKRNGLRT
jgi:hypothetical protein